MRTPPRTARTAPAILALGLALALPGCAAPSAEPAAHENAPAFRVLLDGAARAEPATGRLVVYLIREGAAVEPGAAPSDGPFWDDPQPMYGINVRALRPGDSATVGRGATHFPAPLADLPAGTYRAQAVLDMHRLSSDWRREPGNLFSDVVTFTLDAGRAEPAPVELSLTRAVEPAALPEIEGVELVEVRSELLSRHRGGDVFLRAGVVTPRGYDPAAERTYPAVYEVPGFGGDHLRAADAAARLRSAPTGSPTARLHENAFWIVLDPDGPSGHHLFADSHNNGPVGRALITELIPALEARFRLAPSPSARLLRGHSSGGWATVWLAVTSPETFGAAWSTAPDPLDFRRFQLVNIYADRNMYTRPDGAETPSYRDGGAVKMTIRQENLMEEVLGPNNTSAQQWDSWQAVFGTTTALGAPEHLYHPRAGIIDRGLAEGYRGHDIGHLLRSDPGNVGLIFHQRIRLLVGDLDNFYLEEAVLLVKAYADGLAFLHYPEGRHGYIRILPGHDHDSIHASPEVAAFPEEMLEHLQRAGHLPATVNGS